MKHLVLALLMSLSLAAIASPIPEYPFVVVKGVGRVSLPPDVAVIDLTVRAIEEDAQKAALEVQATSDLVFKKAEEAGLRKADIVAHELSKAQEYSRNENRPREFALRRAIRLSVNDLTRTGGLTDYLLSLKGVEDLRLDFQIRDRRSADEALDRAAATDARRSANQAAGPLNRTVSQAMAISPIPFESISAQFGFPMNRSDLSRQVSAPPPAPKQGQDSYRVPELLHFTKDLYVLFRLE